MFSNPSISYSKKNSCISRAPTLGTGAKVYSFIHIRFKRNRSDGTVMKLSCLEGGGYCRCEDHITIDLYVFCQMHWGQIRASIVY
jgi:hypothetical protein